MKVHVLVKGGQSIKMKLLVITFESNYSVVSVVRSVMARPPHLAGSDINILLLELRSARPVMEGISSFWINYLSGCSSLGSVLLVLKENVHLSILCVCIKE